MMDRSGNNIGKKENQPFFELANVRIEQRCKCSGSFHKSVRTFMLIKISDKNSVSFNIL